MQLCPTILLWAWLKDLGRFVRGGRHYDYASLGRPLCTEAGGTMQRTCYQSTAFVGIIPESVRMGQVISSSVMS